MDARMKWEQLSKSAKDELLDKHRNYNVDHSWWDFTYDDFREQMDGIGISVDRMQFSGFWSQGDGASFDGRVRDWHKLLASLGKTKELEFIAAHKDDYDFTLCWKNTGRYSHENCLSFSPDLSIDNPFDEEEDPLKYFAWEAAYGTAGLLDSIEDELCEFVRDKCRELYKELEAEYEHLTSDDSVIDVITDMYPEEIDEALIEETEEFA